MELLDRWIALVGESPSALKWGRDLLERWSQPHRHYHAVAHLRRVLDALDVLDGEIRSPRTVRLAAWFHDAVYDGRPGDDERASADLARRALTGLGLGSGEVDDVARLVLLTIDHRPAPGDPDGAALCDADLAILGADPRDYEWYADAVRRDYAHVPDGVFRAGRASVLSRLLEREPLFRTPTGRSLWESAARRNVVRELERLQAER